MAKTSLSTLLEECKTCGKDRRNVLLGHASLVLDAETPATEAEVGKVIFRLLIMYESFDRRGEASKTMVIDQWRRSLSGWPVDTLERAADVWINGERSAFVPQPGDILKHCETIGRFRRALAKKARDFLDLSGTK